MDNNIHKSASRTPLDPKEYTVSGLYQNCSSRKMCRVFSAVKVRILAFNNRILWFNAKISSKVADTSEPK